MPVVVQLPGPASDFLHWVLPSHLPGSFDIPLPLQVPLSLAVRQSLPRARAVASLLDLRKYLGGRRTAMARSLAKTVLGAPPSNGARRSLSWARHPARSPCVVGRPSHLCGPEKGA